MAQNPSESILNRLFRRIRKAGSNGAPFEGAIVLAKLANLSIDPTVSFGGQVILAGAGPITIGEQTMIACGAIIHTSTHDYAQHPLWRQRIDRPVEIGRHAWIGAGAIVLPGVRIADFAVVGAGSVVTGHVPARAIVAGSPARIIGYRPEGIESVTDASWSGLRGEAVAEGLLPEAKQCRASGEP